MRVYLTIALVFALVCSGVRSAAAQDVPERARTACDSLRAGDDDAALAQSAQATTEYPENPVVWRVRGYVLSRTGDKTGAMAAYVRAARLDPSDCVSQNNLGSILIEEGDLKAALEVLETAIAACPDYADAINNRGVALERLGRNADAVRAYQAATAADPDHATAHNNLGAIEMRRGNDARAQQSFKRAAAIDPQFAAPALNLAMLHDPTLTDDASLAALVEAASRPGASAAIRSRALAGKAARHARAQRYAEAREAYTAALALRPDDPELLNNLAVVEDQLGDDRFALSHLNAALEIDPGFTVARNNLGIVYVHRGDAKRGEEIFRAIIAEEPRFHRAHYNLGVLMASQGRLSESRSALRTAFRLQPRDAAVRYNLGLLARERGAPPARERRAYEEALALDDTLAEAHLSLGALLADPATPDHLRDLPRARTHLLRFLALAPESDDGGRNRALAWLRYVDSK